MFSFVFTVNPDTPPSKTELFGILCHDFHENFVKLSDLSDFERYLPSGTIINRKKEIGKPAVYAVNPEEEGASPTELKGTPGAVAFSLSHCSHAT